ncbi:MAG: hypothetical protein ACYCPH_01130 [Minisyncoccota bacterium]
MSKQERESKKPTWAKDKHRRALAGTDFEECASCPGCGGKIIEGLMLCARAAGNGVLVTGNQAKRCDGTKPPPYNKIKNSKGIQHPVSASALAT